MTRDFTRDLPQPCHSMQCQPHVSVPYPHPWCVQTSTSASLISNMPLSLCHGRIILHGSFSSLTELCVIWLKDKLRWGDAVTFKSVCKMRVNITSIDFWGSRFASFLGNFLSYIYKHLETKHGYFENLRMKYLSWDLRMKQHIELCEKRQSMLYVIHFLQN